MSDLSTNSATTDGQTPKLKLSEIRAKFPMYDDLPDDQLLAGVRKSYFPSEPIGKFVSRIEFDTDTHDPTSGMTAIELGLAGVGKSMHHKAQGLGQLARKVLPDAVSDAAGLPTQADIDETRALDRPLERTTAGRVGGVIGDLAAVAPTMLIPGAGSLAGAALIGGAQGATEPVASNESRLQNTLLGAGMGAGSVVAGRALKAGWEGGKALIEPFTATGRDRITSRVLNQFAANADDAVQAARAAPATSATGAAPTLAEATKDSGLAQFERALISSDPRVASDLAARQTANNAARVSTLQGVAGDAGQREFFDASRSAAANELYGKAFKTPIDPKAITPEMQKDMAMLMQRPAMQRAVSKARELAAEQGLNMKDPKGSIQGLHYVKMALDDLLATSPQTGLGPTVQRAIADTRSRLVSMLDTMSPAYAEARATFAAMSKPLDQMDIGERLLKVGASAGTDLAGNPRIRAESLARALRDEEALIRAGTGSKVPRQLADVMDPQQLTKLYAVLEEANTRAALDTAGRVTGSPTAQYLAAQNVIDQATRPLGIPRAVMRGAPGDVLRTVGDATSKAGGLVYNATGAGGRLQTRLAQALLDPQLGATLMEKTRVPVGPPESAVVKRLRDMVSSLTPQIAPAAAMQDRR